MEGHKNFSLHTHFASQYNQILSWLILWNDLGRAKAVIIKKYGGN